MLYEKADGKRSYTPRPDMAHLLHFDPHSLLIGATRYFLGRSTIVACCFARHELAPAWQSIPPATRAVLQAEIEKEFDRDDAARRRGSPCLPLGQAVDRSAWQAVRDHWQHQGPNPPQAVSQLPSTEQLAQRLRALATQMRETAAQLEYTAGLRSDLAIAASDITLSAYQAERAAEKLQAQ